MNMVMEYGHGTMLDYSKSMTFFKKACDQGVALGCYNVGNLYFEGYGVKLNNTIASKFFKKACNGGYTEGCNKMNYIDSMLYQKECDGGDTKGCDNLGDLYYNGQGVKQNYPIAAKYFKKACDGGDAKGCYNLGNLYDDGDGVIQNYSIAAKYYKKACDGGNAWGCENLGYLYDNGQGVKQSYSIANKYYKKACKLGDSWGCKRYKSIKKMLKGKPSWWFSFKNYLPHKYSCSDHIVNDSVTENCGSFTLHYSGSSVKNFRIDSNFSTSINSQIAMIAQKKGIAVSNGFNFVPAFIAYIISKTPKSYWYNWNTKTLYSNKVIIISFGLDSLIGSGNITDLNNIIKPFVREKLK